MSSRVPAFSHIFNSRNALSFAQRLHREISDARINIFELMRAELQVPDATAEELLAFAFATKRADDLGLDVERIFSMVDFVRDLGAAQIALLDASTTFIKRHKL